MTEPKPPESTNTNVSWKDTFLLEHPLSRLPNDEVRGAFSVILENGQGVRDYYSARYDKDGKEVGIPDEKFDVGIGKDQLGDSPRKQLIHEIGNTRLRAESLRTGVLKNWRYQESHSEEFTKFWSLRSS
ncbi:MAG: hypothetical protein HYV38_00975 [Candidatus Levybacteria bacterium]|nr:hypothetical protein [Candidatus Levybacteria bacterium]